MSESTEPFPALETARLRLRCVVRDDAAWTARLMTQAVCERIAGWPFPLDTSMVLQRIERVRDAAWARRSLPVALERKADGMLIGWVGVDRDPEQPDRAGLGYWIGEAFQRQGFAGEALPPILDLAFRQLDVQVIEGGAHLDNRASLAVLRGLGMTRTQERQIFVRTRNRAEVFLFHELRR